MIFDMLFCILSLFLPIPVTRIRYPTLTDPIIHTKSVAKLHIISKLCKRLRKKNKINEFYMFYSIKYSTPLARVKKNMYLCKLIYVYWLVSTK